MNTPNSNHSNNQNFHSLGSNPNTPESIWLEQMHKLEQELLVREEQIQNLLSLLETKSIKQK